MSTAKTAAGLVLATGTTTAVSYAITDSVSNKQEPTPTGQTTTPAATPQPKKMGQILEEAKFTKLTFENSGRSRVSEMSEIQKILKKFPNSTATDQAGKKKELKSECEEKTNKEYNETDYKLLVQKCVKLDSFKQRATKLKLVPLDTNVTNGVWTTQWGDNFQTKFQTEVAKSKFSKEFTTYEENKLKEYCKKVEDLSVNDFSSDVEITKEWGVYGNLCLPKSTTNKDFWLGDSSIKG